MGFSTIIFTRRNLKRANGADVPMSPNETPVVRFLNEPDNSNSWNTFRKLSDEEVLKLAKSMVKEVKFRGPFLSFSDFVNRRLAPGPCGTLAKPRVLSSIL